LRGPVRVAWHAQRCGQAAGALVPKFSDIYLTGEA